MKKYGFAFASSLIAGGLTITAAPAMAQDKFELSGQVSRALMFARDGAQSRTFFVDNGNASTRMRFRGTREVRTGLKAGLLIEAAYASNPSADVGFGDSSIPAELDERHIDVFLDGSWGRVSLGQSNGAANGAMEVDLSGTDVVSNSDMADIGGGLEFRDSNGDTGPSIGETFDNLDFESRYDRLRYDSVTFGTTTFSVSAGDKSENEVYEIAARSRLKWRGGDMRAAVGYSTESRGGNAGSEQTIGGSVSYAMPTGFNGTLAYGMRSDDAPDSADRDFFYGKLGYVIGSHAVSIDYGVSTDEDETGDNSTAYGVAYVYTAAKWIDLYAGAKLHKLNREGSNFETISIVTAGTRLKF